MTTFNIIIYSTLPTFLYIFFIYSVLPYNTFKIRKSLLYWGFGALSILLVMGFYKLFPNWSNLPSILTNMYTDKLGYLHIRNFIQIGLLEELSKMIMFLLLGVLGSRLPMFKALSPIETMLYCGFLALGFAGVENIYYGQNVNNPEFVLKLRSITSVPAHLIFGLYMGYFIAKGKLILRIKNKSYIDLLLSNNKFRKVIFGLFGLFVAMVLHGIYNLHIALNTYSFISGTYIFLFAATFGLYWCYNDIRKITS